MIRRLLLAAMLVVSAITAVIADPPTQPPYASLGGQAVLAVSSVTSNVALPTTTVPFGAATIFNKGTTDAYVALGVGNTTAATTSSTLVPAGAAITIWINQNTYLAAITASSTTNLVVYQATGPVDFAASSSGGGTVTIGPGSSVIGKVGIDQTTPGTTNAVQSTAASKTQIVDGSGNVIGSTSNSLNTNDSLINGVAPQMGNGTTGTGTQRVAISSDSNGQVSSITASSTGTTAATTATLAALASNFTYICGFTITSDATAALAGAATVTGTASGTLNYIQNVGSATAAGVLQQTFSPCVRSSAVNTAIVVTSVAAGTGGNTAVTAWGFQGP